MNARIEERLRRIHELEAERETDVEEKRAEFRDRTKLERLRRKFPRL
jgi:hypothetical protein